MKFRSALAVMLIAGGLGLADLLAVSAEEQRGDSVRVPSDETVFASDSPFEPLPDLRTTIDAVGTPDSEPAIPTPIDSRRVSPPSMPTDGVAASDSEGELSIDRVEPRVEIQQSAPERIKPGEPVPITISVVNVGSTTVDNVVVTNPIPQDCTLLVADPMPREGDGPLVWSLGRLQVGQRFQIHLQLATTPRFERASVRNAPTVSFEAGVVATTKVVAPKLILAITGAEKGVVGEPITLSISVANVGNAPAEGVLFRNHIPDGLLHPYGPSLENEIGYLEVGETRRVNLTLTPTKSGKIVNTVVVDGRGIKPVKRTVVFEIEEVQLALQATGPSQRYVNRTCQYEFTIKHEGSTPARNVRIDTALPEGIVFADASDDGQYDAEANAVFWAFDSVEPGATKTVALTGVATKIGEQVVRAVMTTAPGASPREARCLTEVRGVSAFRMEVRDLEDPIEVGAETIYEVRVVNQGTIEATNIRVVLTIPPEMEATAADGPDGPNGPISQTLEEGALSFDPVPTLAPKESVTFQVKVRGNAKGDCRMKVTLTTDQLQTS